MGGAVAEEFDEATLPLLFKAARWERTLQMTKIEHIEGRMGQSACSALKQGQGLQGIFRSLSDWSHTGA